MALDTTVSSVIDACSIYGSESGTAEGAFACASGSDPSLIQNALFGLLIAGFLLLWVRLIHQSWNKFNKKDYEFKDVMKVVIFPPFLLVFIAVIVSSWGFS
ncbi:TPA: hypothetical protein I7C77_003460 [Vibrio cholerae]|nr:hypothetical protein [Vibrio cholerae]